MAFHVLIVEDVPDIRGIIQDSLEKTIIALDQKVPWILNWPSHAGIEFDIKAANAFQIQRCVDAASHEDELRNAIDSLSSDKEGIDLIILDLALTPKETTDLQECGGRDVEGGTNPLAALEQTTGFKLLKLLKEKYPVIVTTFANNPRVSRHCLETGAHAVVTKPLKDEHMTLVYDLRKASASVSETIGISPDKQEQNKLLAIPVDTYLTVLATEVLKAFKETALQRIVGYAPRHIPFWITAEHSEIPTKSLQNTNLMLMDVRGSSKLVEICKEKPEGVFHLMNTVWRHILEVLKEYDAEVNNFNGDAALVFRGVYPLPGKAVKLQETVACALKIALLFRPNGEVRNDLLTIIKGVYNYHLFHESGSFKRIENLISSNEFGMRIVITAPDYEEALFGRMGTERRWQHTILSRFVNALARAESRVSQWEKAGRIEREPAHVFLLWSTYKDLPTYDGIRFLPHEEYVKGEREAIPDVPEGMEVYKVVKDGP